MATTDESRLLVRLEATATKLINEMKKASAVTVSETTKIGDAAYRSNRRVADALTQQGAAWRNASAGLGNMRGQVQSTAFQVQDFAVQVASGTDATRALAQQLPQLLGGLGVFGAVAGAAAAIAIPLAASFFSSGEEAETAADKLDTLEKATKAYSAAAKEATTPIVELKEKYGELADEIQRALDLNAKYRRQEAITALGSAIDENANSVVRGASSSDLKSSEVASVVAALQQLERIRALQASMSAETARAFDFTEELAQIDRVLGAYGNIQTTIVAIADAYGITIERAASLAVAAQRVKQAEDTAGRVAAASRLVEMLDEIAQRGGKGADEAKKLAQELNDAVINAGEIASTDMAGTIGAAADQAERLRRLLARIGQEDPVIFDPRDPRYNRTRATMAQLADQAGDTSPFAPVAVKTSTGGGGGVGGGGSRSPDQLQRVLELGQREIEQLQQRIALVGQDAETVARLTAEAQLLNAAKSAGLDLDRVVNAQGETLRATIEAQAAAIGRLTVQQQQATEQAAFFSRQTEAVQDGLIDAIVAGESLAGVMANVAREIAKAALQAALFGRGPMAALFGGASPGGLFGGFGGFRADGGPVQAGKAYVVGERGPEVFQPRSSGFIVPNLDGMRSGAKAPVVNVAPAQPVVSVAIIDDAERIGDYLASSPRAETAVMRILKRNQR